MLIPSIKAPPISAGLSDALGCSAGVAALLHFPPEGLTAMPKHGSFSGQIIDKPVEKRVWAAHKAFPKTRPTDTEAFFSLRHGAPKPRVVLGPVAYVHITHATEWIKPMASGLQKNEQSVRNGDFVAVNNRTSIVEVPHLKEVKSFWRKASVHEGESCGVRGCARA